ncbi:hypothetical protein WT11_15230 [Burkholderia stagnalis]|nr:hypothetical protein WT11_15230 [Burkholderia stagnalis]
MHCRALRHEHRGSQRRIGIITTRLLQQLTPSYIQHELWLITCEDTSHFTSDFVMDHCTVAVKLRRSSPVIRQHVDGLAVLIHFLDAPAPPCENQSLPDCQRMSNWQAAELAPFGNQAELFVSRERRVELIVVDQLLAGFAVQQHAI